MGRADRDADTIEHADVDADPDANAVGPVAYTDANADNSDVYPDANADIDTDTNPDKYPVEHADDHEHADEHPDGHAAFDLDANADPDGDASADQHADGDSYAHPDSYANVHAYVDPTVLRWMLRPVGLVAWACAGLPRVRRRR